ncbi:response regulator transcription factor [Nocardioides sp. B-3]|uniref:response regulator transcription factor n=1 Tax=Nocardioides sp. B-3 TaxID=2895565 RepID=UPI002152642D|nr:LuxR C-terminal-related transcriptional regulator [Nocardioides sp. B-3]UUZ61020.1 LuxR C-terminal-related transcriptional regulator [Nocardioides sp. B-3]
MRDGSDGRGYLLKERVADVDELVSALRIVAAGGSVIDQLVVDAPVATSTRRPHSVLDRLTPRELEVLAMVARGMTNAAIAAELVVTDRAVEKHINSILSKLDLPADAPVHRRVAATPGLPERGRRRRRQAAGMTRLVPRWSGADPDLARLMRLNYIALTMSFVVPGTAYALGFRHTAVLIDPVAMAVAEALLLASLPMTRRYGDVACVLALALSATAFAVVGHLEHAQPGRADDDPDADPAPGGLPLRLARLAGRPDGQRDRRQCVAGRAVGVAAGRQRQRELGGQRGRHRVCAARHLPHRDLPVRNAYRRLRDQSDQLRQSRTRGRGRRRGRAQPRARPARRCTAAVAGDERDHGARPQGDVGGAHGVGRGAAEAAVPRQP